METVEGTCMNGPRMCDECQKPCQPLVSKTRPQSSEWYCEPCHRSYPMYEEGDDPETAEGIEA